MGSNPTIGSMNTSPKEFYLSKFQAINEQFHFELNDEQTRQDIIRSYYQLFDKNFLGKFVDVTTSEQMYQGIADIRVEMPSGDLLTIEEFCETMEKYDSMF